MKLSNYQFINAVLYVAENGCQWRALPSEYGKWFTVYQRFNRWVTNGVMARIFSVMQQAQIIKVNVEVLTLDATSVKVHPDGHGALKKRSTSHRKVPGRMEYQASHGIRR